MAKQGLQASTKRALIGKANSTMVITISIAAFLATFSLVAIRSLLIKRSYQARVISTQEKARNQLESNIKAVDSLKTSYEEFVSRPQNLIGGSSTGTGAQDGDNAKIILDALPSKYDFPALTASLEKILKDRNYTILSISGIDEETLQNSSGTDKQHGGAPTASASTVPAATTTQPATTPSGAVEMPFELGVSGEYNSVIALFDVFQRSIRPLYMSNITISSKNLQNNAQIEMTAEGKTFYQPEKKFEIKYETVK